MTEKLERLLKLMSKYLDQPSLERIQVTDFQLRPRRRTGVQNEQAYPSRNPPLEPQEVVGHCGKHGDNPIMDGLSDSWNMQRVFHRAFQDGQDEGNNSGNQGSLLHEPNGRTESVRHVLDLQST